MRHGGALRRSGAGRGHFVYGEEMKVAVVACLLIALFITAVMAVMCVPALVCAFGFLVGLSVRRISLSLSHTQQRISADFCLVACSISCQLLNAKSDSDWSFSRGMSKIDGLKSYQNKSEKVRAIFQYEGVTVV